MSTETEHFPKNWWQTRDMERECENCWLSCKKHTQKKKKKSTREKLRQNQNNIICITKSMLLKI